MLVQVILGGVDVFGGGGAGDVEALGAVAVECFECVELVWVFDAFGDYGESEGVGGLDHELEEFAGGVVGRVEKDLVEFEDVDG